MSQQMRTPYDRWLEMWNGQFDLAGQIIAPVQTGEAQLHDWLCIHAVEEGLELQIDVDGRTGDKYIFVANSGQAKIML